ncbi:F-box only protein 46 [Pogona vitticeps]
MDQNTFSHIQLWCPRPFGTYSQNKQCAGGQVRKTFGDFACKAKEDEEGGVEAWSENTPPAPPPPLPPPPPPPPPPPSVSPTPSQLEEGRVLLDTWYVIKPGNTKEKIAFFVAHQCSSGNRASAMKVKGNWGSDSSKAKRRRRSHDPSKNRACPVKSKDASGGSKEAEDVCLCPESHTDPAGGDATDLLSVAEMVALVEQRTALALQSYARPSLPAAPPSPMVFVSTEQEECREKKAPPSGAGSDCSRVAEAVAHFESREQNVLRQNGLCREPPECVANSQQSPGEVRIAFRISSSRDPRSPTEGGSGTRPNCMFMSCGGSPTGNPARAKDKITCDLYQLISPSRDTLPNNVDFLLASASPKGADGSGGEPPDVEMTCGESQGPSGKLEPIPENGRAGGEKVGGLAAATARDCVSGFHVDVVVTGVVDQCVFFGKDSTKNMKEETVCLTVGSPTQEGLCSSCEDPPPGQLFFLHAQPAHQEDSREAEGSFLDEGGLERADGSGLESAASDTSLCRLYRHVSHDFLEIRFKIQRLLEPRQYMLLLPDHIMVKIFSYLPTQSLAALKCSCHYFKCIIETFGVQATDSKWNRDPLYRDDPCKQCKKHYEKGDVSLCRWHPKPYHHDLPYGRSYWMCCRRTDKDTPGCRVGLHDNNWVQPCDTLRERAARREDGR